MKKGALQGVEEAIREVGAKCRAQRTSQIEHFIEESFLRQKEYFAFKLRALIRGSGDSTHRSAVSGVREPISSLSQLRKLIPCRFSTLRERWVEAALPLKRERKVVKKNVGAGCSITKESLAHFEKWLGTFGFHLELAPNEEEILFYLVK